MNFVIRKSFFISYGLLIGLYFLGIHINRTFSLFKNFLVSVDYRLSECAMQEIREYIAHIKPCSTNDFTTLINEIKQRFQYVNHVNIDCTPPQQIAISCHSYIPICIINSTRLLLESGTLIQKNYYVQRYLDKLHCINVDQSLLAQCSWQDLIKCIPLIEPHFFDQYNISYDNQGQICFYHNSAPLFSLICRTDFQFNNLKLYEQAVIRLIEQRHNALKFKNIIWTADLRFEKQIILKHDRGKNG